MAKITLQKNVLMLVGYDNDIPEAWRKYKNLHIIGDGKTNISDLSKKLLDYKEQVNKSDEPLELIIDGHGSVHDRNEKDERHTIEISKGEENTVKIFNQALEILPNIDTSIINSCHSGAFADELAKNVENNEQFAKKEIKVITSAGAKYSCWGEDIIRTRLKDLKKEDKGLTDYFVDSSVTDGQTKNFVDINDQKVIVYKGAAAKNEEGIKHQKGYLETPIVRYDKNDKEKSYQDSHIYERYRSKKHSDEYVEKLTSEIFDLRAVKVAGFTLKDFDTYILSCAIVASRRTKFERLKQYFEAHKSLFPMNYHVYGSDLENSTAEVRYKTAEVIYKFNNHIEFSQKLDADQIIELCKEILYNRPESYFKYRESSSSLAEFIQNKISTNIESAKNYKITQDVFMKIANQQSRYFKGNNKLLPILDNLFKKISLNSSKSYKDILSDNINEVNNISKLTL